MNKDITLFQEQSNGEFLEKKVSPVAHQVIGFDVSQNPVSKLAQPFVYMGRTSPDIWNGRIQSESKNWQGVALSADGMKLAACDNGGYIYTSTDGGANWTARIVAGSRIWQGITSSADGMKLAACVLSGYIYTSTDGGANWTEQTSAGSKSWPSIASSADGMRIISCDVGGYVYTSIDGGTNWTQLTALGAKSWGCVSSSADGMKLVAGDVADNGHVYTSSNGGVDWIDQAAPAVSRWYKIASSADGKKLLFCRSITSILFILEVMSYTNLDEDSLGRGIIIPQNETWLCDVILLGVNDDYSVCRWSFKFAVQNTGPLIGIVGSIEGKAASFDAGDIITPDYIEFGGQVVVDVSQSDSLIILATTTDGGSVDWSASGSIVKIVKPAIGGGGSSGSS